MEPLPTLGGFVQRLVYEALDIYKHFIFGLALCFAYITVFALITYHPMIYTHCVCLEW